MKEGTVAQWFKKEGEAVTKGEPLVEVLSEKATVDVEAPVSGILWKILAMQGVDMPVNATLAIITAPDEQVTEADLQALEAKREGKKEAVVETLEVKTEALSSVEERVLASPAAKRLAREHEIDLTQVKGTGPEGRIVEEDVQGFIQQVSQTGPRVKEIIQLTGIKKTTAERVSRSFRTAPHSTVIMDVDMTNATKLRSEKQISYTELLVKAVAETLMKYPLLNSTLEEDERIKVYEDVNIGVAVATEQGLVVPVIRDADKKSLEEIAAKLRELAEKARLNQLAKDDVSGGTFTITNLGMYGVDLFMPIINPPEAAILAVGRIANKPVVEGKEIVIKSVITLSLAYDHRIIDGAPAAQFLQEIKKTLETSTL
jgi:pyruvate dehydrogenase E2 component (dihydrolipoamide acetyltransferase)